MRVASLLLVALFLSAAPGIEHRVQSVYDGATMLTEDNLRVRLLGVAAPSMFDPGGDISRDVLEKHVVGRTVRLEGDGPDADGNGRLLRYVYVGDTLVNALVMRKGFVHADIPDSSLQLRYADTLLRLERTAARIGKGLWPFEVFPPPSFKGPDEFVDDTTGSDPWIETVSWDETDEHYGRLVRVIGTVVATYRSDKVFIMNFHQDYRRHFKAVVFSGDLDKFPPYPEDHYKRRVVRLTGLIKEYQGAAEMIITDPGQIEILE